MDNNWVHLSFANIFVAAKYFGSKSLVFINKLLARMILAFKSEMHSNNYLVPILNSAS